MQHKLSYKQNNSASMPASKFTNIPGQAAKKFFSGTLSSSLYELMGSYNNQETAVINFFIKMNVIHL